MSIQTAPFLSRRQKDLLHAAGYTTTFAVSTAMPVHLWRLVSRAGNIVPPPQQQPAAADQLPSATSHNENNDFCLKTAAKVIQMCRDDVRGSRPPPPPPTSHGGHRVGDEEDDDDAAAQQYSATPLCSAVGVTPTPIAAAAGGAANAGPTKRDSITNNNNPNFTVKTMAQLLKEEEEGIQPTQEVLGGSSAALPSSPMARQHRIVTFSESIDALCGGGGVECGCLTEVVGAPGMGKTQLCMQLAVSVQLPQCFGGLEGECIYIDTEGSFVPSRFREIAVGAAAQVQKIIQLQQRGSNGGGGGNSDAASSSSSSAAAHFTVDGIMKRVHYLRITRLADLLALIEALPAAAQMVAAGNHKKFNHQQSQQQQQQYRPIRLVIIDSIAFHFRSALGGDAQLRARTLNHVGQRLQQHAMAMGAAVVVSNQLTSGGGGGGSDAQSSSAAAATTMNGTNGPSPALGDSWAHTLTYRLWIQAATPILVHNAVVAKQQQQQQHDAINNSHTNNNSINNSTSEHLYQQQQAAASAILSDPSVRSMLVVKSPVSGRSTSLFRITNKGIRNVNISV